MSLGIIVSNYHLFLTLIASLLSCASLIKSENSDNTLVRFWCSDAKLDPETPYRNNLNKLLSSLRENAGQNTSNGYYATNSTALGAGDSEVIYGLFLCRGDTTPGVCEGCVSAATASLPHHCPTSKTAIIWYDACMVRCSNESQLGAFRKDASNLVSKTSENISSVGSYVNASMHLGCNTLDDLASRLGSADDNQGLSSSGGHRKYYSTKEVAFNSFVRVFTMAQCTPDLSPTDCELYLRIIVDETREYCNLTTSVRMLNPNCNTRCEIYALNHDQPSPPIPLPIAQGNFERKRIFLLVTLPASAAILFVLLCGVFMFKQRQRRRWKAMETTRGEVSEIKNAVDSLQFDFKTIRMATCNFDEDKKLGEGGFGKVYKGKLESGQEIAVKRLSEKSEQGVAQFKTEAVLVAKLRHKNLVKLLGFCVALKEKILVYEFLPNLSFDRFLFDEKNKASLDWKTRFKIIIGIARGLVYLHEDSPLKVIHRDLKSSNILLDDDMKPKISDFGLAKLFQVDQTQGDTKRIVGTYGYMAPEYAITGHYSVKSDIYSFGVLLLETVSGQRNRFCQGLQLIDKEALLHLAWRLWNENKALDLVDSTLCNNFPEEEVMKCIHIGLLSIQESAIERPSMSSIVAALSGQSISLPSPKPPHFFGAISNFEDNLTDLGRQYDSTYVFSGTATFTDLHPRD